MVTTLDFKEKMYKSKTAYIVGTVILGSLLLSGCSSANTNNPKPIATVQSGVESLTLMDNIYDASMKKIQEVGTVQVSNTKTFVYDFSINKEIGIIYKTADGIDTATAEMLVASPLSSALSGFPVEDFKNLNLKIDNTNQGTFTLRSSESEENDNTKIVVYTKDGLITSYEYLLADGSIFDKVTISYGGVSDNDKKIIKKLSKEYEDMFLPPVQ